MITWLNKSVKNAEVEIEGYEIFRLDRKDKRGGGVCAYIRSPLKAQILKDLSGTSTTWFQQLWLQVQYKKIRSFVICAVYRPPDCHVSCFEDFVSAEQILCHRPSKWVAPISNELTNLRWCNCSPISDELRYTMLYKNNPRWRLTRNWRKFINRQ